MTDWRAEYLALHVQMHRARRRLGLTQAGAADLIEVCERTFRDFEAGRGDLPAAKMFQLADALGIHIHVQGSQ